MTNTDQISSHLSTLFLNDFELPDVNEVKKLISCKHSEKLCYDNGIDSLNDIICALLLQKLQFFSLCNVAYKTASKSFAKKFSYQGEMLEKNILLVAIELVLAQDELLSTEDVQCIVDYQKCVVLFNQTSIEQLSDTFDFLLELFEFESQFENEYLVLSEQKKLINSNIRKMKKGFDEVDQNIVGRSCNVLNFNECMESQCYCEHDCVCDFYW